jgi:hypothetical protein
MSCWIIPHTFGKIQEQKQIEASCWEMPDAWPISCCIVTHTFGNIVACQLLDHHTEFATFVNTKPIKCWIITHTDLATLWPISCRIIKHTFGNIVAYQLWNYHPHAFGNIVAYQLLDHHTNTFRNICQHQLSDHHTHIWQDLETFGNIQEQKQTEAWPMSCSIITHTFCFATFRGLAVAGYIPSMM